MFWFFCFLCSYILNNQYGHRQHSSPSSPAWPPPPSPSLIHTHEPYGQRSPTQPYMAHSPVSPGHYGQSGIPSPSNRQYCSQGYGPSAIAMSPSSPLYTTSRNGNVHTSSQFDHSAGHITGQHSHGHFWESKSPNSSPRGHPRNDLQSRLNPHGHLEDKSPGDGRSDQDNPDYGRTDHQHIQQFGQSNSMGLDPYSGYRYVCCS